MDAILITGQKVLTSMPYFGAIAVILFLGKLLFDKTTTYQFDEELTTKDNKAFGTTLALYFVGLAIALSGLGFGIGTSPLDDLLNIAIYGPMTLAFVRLSILVNNTFILHQFDVHKEIIQDRNVGTAFVVGGGCVATGLTISGALSGESASAWMGVVDLLYYFVLGQVLLIVGGYVFQLITSYDVHKVIGRDDNVAAGLSFGGFLVAIGIIMRVALAGAGSNLAVETVTTLILAVFGVVLLVLVRVITDKVLLPKSSLSKEIAVDRNVAAGAVAAASFISVALVYAVSIGS